MRYVSFLRNDEIVDQMPVQMHLDQHSLGRFQEFIIDLDEMLLSLNILKENEELAITEEMEE